MQDTLDLYALRQDIASDDQLHAKLKRWNRTALYILVGTVLLVLGLQVSFWIYEPTMLALLTGFIYFGWLTYYRLRQRASYEDRVRQTVATLLPPDQLRSGLVAARSMIVEIPLLGIAFFTGLVFLNGYRRANIPITLDVLIQDLSIAPQWAVPFLVSWGIVALILLHWLFILVQNRAHIRRLNRISVGPALGGIFGFGMIMVVAVWFAFEPFNITLFYLLVIGSWFLIGAYRLSLYAQVVLDRRIVLPYAMKGDYATALSRVQSFRRFFLVGEYLRFREMTLNYYSGDLTRGNTMAWEWLRDYQNFRPVTVANPVLLLADAAIKEERYDDALSLAEAVVAIYPSLRIGYSLTARVYLKSGQNPERALELETFALEVTTVPPLSSPHSGVRAVALAQLGDFEAADKELSLVDVNSFKWVLEHASLHIDRARVAQARGDISSARQHLEAAIDVDSQGINAITARELLADLPHSET